MKKTGFTLIELLVVIVIMSILSGLGVTSFHKYSANAKDKVAKKNYETIKENMKLEFVRCELNEKAKIFNSHNCNSGNSPTVNTINNYVNNSLKLKNPYDNKQQVAQSNICTSGSVVIAKKETGSYNVSYASVTKEEKYTSTVSSKWSSSYTQTTSIETSFTCTSSVAKYKWKKTNEHKARRISDPSEFDWNGQINGRTYGTYSRTIIRQGSKRFFAAELGITDYNSTTDNFKECKDRYQKIKDGTLTNKTKRWGYPAHKDNMYAGGKGLPYATDSLRNGRC